MTVTAEVRRTDRTERRWMIGVAVAHCTAVSVIMVSNGGQDPGFIPYAVCALPVVAGPAAIPWFYTAKDNLTGLATACMVSVLLLGVIGWALSIAGGPLMWGAALPLLLSPTRLATGRGPIPAIAVAVVLAAAVTALFLWP